jgi:hypothetical protein
MERIEKALAVIAGNRAEHEQLELRMEELLVRAENGIEALREILPPARGTS